MTNTYFDLIDTASFDQLLESGAFPFSKYLFWDVAIETIDTSKNKNFIIERVLQKGFLKDFYLLVNMYAPAEIIAAIKKSKVLDKKTVNFCSHYFNIPLNQLHASAYYS